jgi:hypothetical protein
MMFLRKKNAAAVTLPRQLHAGKTRVAVQKIGAGPVSPQGGVKTQKNLPALKSRGEVRSYPGSK